MEETELLSSGMPTAMAPEYYIIGSLYCGTAIFFSFAFLGFGADIVVLWVCLWCSFLYFYVRFHNKYITFPHSYRGKQKNDW